MKRSFSLFLFSVLVLVGCGKSVEILESKKEYKPVLTTAYDSIIAVRDGDNESLVKKLMTHSAFRKYRVEGDRLRGHLLTQLQGRNVKGLALGTEGYEVIQKVEGKRDRWWGAFEVEVQTRPDYEIVGVIKVQCLMENAKAHFWSSSKTLSVTSCQVSDFETR